LGIGDWAQSPIPNPQSPIPILYQFFNNLIFKKLLIIKTLKKIIITNNILLIKSQIYNLNINKND
jgi:hypothetical protein